MVQVEYFFYLKPGAGFNPDLENFRALFINGKLQRYGRWGGFEEAKKPNFNCFIDNKDPNSPIEYSGFITESGDCTQVLRKGKNMEFLGQLKKFKAEGKCLEYDRQNDQFLTIMYENGVPRGPITVDNQTIRYQYLVGKFRDVKSAMDTSVCSGVYKDDESVEFGIQTDYKEGVTRRGIFEQADLKDGEVESSDRVVKGMFKRVYDAKLGQLQQNIEQGEIRFKNGNISPGKKVEKPAEQILKYSGFELNSDRLQQQSAYQAHEFPTIALNIDYQLNAPIYTVFQQALMSLRFRLESFPTQNHHWDSIKPTFLLKKLPRLPKGWRWLRL